MTLPARFRTHTITVEPYEGSGGFEAVYGDPVEVTCRVEDEIRMVRNSAGVEVVSSTTVFCDLDVVIPPESRVTIGDRVTTVISTSAHDTAGQSPLEHKEVSLL